MERQKKFALGVTGLILLFILLAAGCKQPSSPSQGLLGQVNGVVVDSVTGQPIKGVEVGIRGTTLKAVTDARGAYLIKNVPTGEDYVITYVKPEKAGETKYRFTTSGRVDVDPTRDLTGSDDSFAEYEKLLEQAIELAKNGVVVDILDYTYSWGEGQYITFLSPLTGGIKGNIKVFKAVYADRKNVKLEDAVAAANVEFWLKEISFTNNNTYGPYYTGADGSISVPELPVGVEMVFTTNGFSSGGYYYKAKPDVYTYNGSSNEFSTVASSFFETLQGQAQLQPVYLFAEPDYVLVTAFTAGTSALALTRTGEITLTFNKDIDPATFSANLQFDNGSPTTSGMVPLLALWQDTKTVTLKGGQGPGLLEGFPYSADGAKPVGRLDITGKATDGSNVFADASGSTAGLPVFTQAGLKAVLDLAPAGIPAARAAISSTAVKLTFNKAVNPASAKFTWGATNAADYTFAADNLSVFIYTDLLNSTTGQSLYWTVAAAADPLDIVSNVSAGGTSETFTSLPANRPLILSATNIYTNRTDGPISNDANFPVASNITLTFTRAIPAGSKVQAALGEGSALSNFTGTSIPITSSISGAVLTIDPTLDLNANSTYYLRLKITNGTETIFEESSLSAYHNSLLIASGGNIEFQTVNPYTSAVGSGAANSVTDISFSSGSATYGKTYYVQFSKPLNISGGELATNNPDVSVVFGTLGDRVLTVIFKYIGATTPVPTETATATLGGGAGSINTSSGTFSLSNMSVSP